jgi:hypothetical protein
MMRLIFLHVLASAVATFSSALGAAWNIFAAADVTA